MNSTDADNSLQNPVNTMEQTLLAYCRRQGLFRLGDRVIVACSGGADSMALLCFLLRCKAELGITVMAAHVDHGIRGEAAHADARFVAEFCRTHHVPFFLYDAAASGVQIPPNPSENWARSLRYTWFDALAAQQHACIATAHTLSDQAETVLFRMARGTGLHGMAGIPAVRGVYRRPFLCLTRSDTTAYCAALGQHYVQDESNFSDAYARNRIRHYAVPALQTINPAAERAVGRLCNQLQELNIWLENLAEKLLAQADCGDGYSIPILAAADAPVLAAALRMLAARARDPEEKYVQALAAIVRQGSGAVQLTPDACWTAANGILYCRSVLKMQPEAIPAPHQLLKTGVYCLPGGYELEIQQLNYEVFLKNPSFLKKDYTYCADYAKINKNIFVRTRQPGDTFRPAGRHVGKTLKKYLNETKVPVAERTLMPLLACGSQVLWLWGAGFADGLSPDDGTKQILLIRQSRQPAAPGRNKIIILEEQIMHDMNNDIAKVLISEEQLQAKVAELGAQISRDYVGKDLLLVSILKGSVVFMADLMRAITEPCSIDFMVVSSYGGANTTSTGLVKIVKDLDQDLSGKDVLIVEDILDTGVTLSHLVPMLKLRRPNSVRLCTILSKPSRRKVDIEPDYCGFEVPDEFVVGYGLDYDEKYRNLPYVGVLKPEVYSK